MLTCSWRANTLYKLDWEGGRFLSDKSADKKQDRENIFFSMTSGDEQNLKVCCPQWCTLPAGLFLVQLFTVETDLLWMTMLFFPTQMKCLHSFQWKQKKCLVNLKFKISQKDLTKKIQWPIKRNNFLKPARELPPKKNKDSNPYPSRLTSQSLLWHHSLSGTSLCQSLLQRALRQQVCHTSSKAHNFLPVFSWVSELWPQSKWIWEENTLIRHSLSQALGF